MILARYIIREHISPFFFGLFLIVFIFTLNLFFRMLPRIVGKGLSLRVIAEFFFLNLAWIFALAIPMAVLIATLSAYGRMSSDGEITALRSSGISPWQMISPALVVSVFIAIGVVLYNNYLLPEMNHRTKLLSIDISRKKPTFNIEPGIYAFNIKNYVFHAVGINQETSELETVSIYDEHIPDKRSTITARRGRLRFEPGEEVIYLNLVEGEIHSPASKESFDYEWTQFDSALFRVPAPGLVLKRGAAASKSDREKSVGEMLRDIKELRKQKESRHILRRISSYLVEIHKKFSIPVACIVFIIVGAPLGILAHKGGIGVSGGISLLFFTLYWAFLVNGEDLADRGIVSPAMAMWMPNVILAVVGGWLIGLARRRTTLPGVDWVSNLISRWLNPVAQTNKGDENRP